MCSARSAPSVSGSAPGELATASEERDVHAAVDLHCHILPGLDDGARDLDDAIGMARQAHADGIAAICATPHIRHDHDVAIDGLPERIAELSSAVRASRCRTRILPGGEVAATVLDGLEDGELAAVSLGGAGRWILLEPAPGPLDDRLEQAVETLRRRGFAALLAHPERHPGHDLLDRLRRLVARGALVQATAASVLDEATRPGMLALARAGVLHVLGSDSHSSRVGRPVALADALDSLRGIAPIGGHLRWIARIAPRAIVSGEALSVPFAVRP